MTSTRKFLYIFTPFTLLCIVIIVLNANRDSDSRLTQNVSDSLVQMVKLDSLKAKSPHEVMPNRYVEGLKLNWNEKYDSGYFRFPLDSNYGLSGSFGELRSNHFHAGLDLRTLGVEGLPVYASADGYVARIKVSVKGYGKALYLIHPNGYQTVYGHLSKFNPSISEYVKKKQYQYKSFEVEDYPKAQLLKVRKGDIIAYSGNTGGSGGPHLHFEIRNGRTGKSINPILFGVGNNDHMPPEIKDVAIYSIQPIHYHQTGNYPVRYFNRKKILNKTIVLPPGAYGIGCHSDDYFTDRFNKLGVNRAYLAVNGKIRFTQFIKSITFSQGRYINKHIDFASNRTKGKRFVRFYHEQSNPLNYYRHLKKGYIELRHNDTLKVAIKAFDYSDGSDAITFTLIGSIDEEDWNKSKRSEVKNKFSPHKANNFTSPLCNMSFPRGALYDSLYFTYSNDQKAGVVYHHVGNVLVPLQKYCSIKLKLKEGEQPNAQTCIASFSSNKEVIYEGGIIEGNWMKTRTRSFGTYFITADTMPPQLKFVSNKNKQLVVKLSDDFSGIKSFKVSINNKWVLMEYEPKSHRLFGEIPDWIKTGKAELKITATDQRNNTSQLSRTIIIQ